jgi:Kelch motif
LGQGGRNYQGFLKSVELLDLKTKRWREMKHLELKGDLLILRAVRKKSAASLYRQVAAPV